MRNHPHCASLLSSPKSAGVHCLPRILPTRLNPMKVHPQTRGAFVRARLHAHNRVRKRARFCPRSKWDRSTITDHYGKLDEELSFHVRGVLATRCLGRHSSPPTPNSNSHTFANTFSIYHHPMCASLRRLVYLARFERECAQSGGVRPTYIMHLVGWDFASLDAAFYFIYYVCTYGFVSIYSTIYEFVQCAVNFKHNFIFMCDWSSHCRPHWWWRPP